MRQDISSDTPGTVTLPDHFAERRLDLLKPSGERVAFRVEFGPIRGEGQDFHCRVRFYGWGDSPPDIWGYDSLQALGLAVTLVRSILCDFVQRGGRVLWPGADADFDLDEFCFS
jgi:hypothetical protein